MYPQISCQILFLTANQLGSELMGWTNYLWDSISKWFWPQQIVVSSPRLQPVGAILAALHGFVGWSQKKSCLGLAMLLAPNACPTCHNFRAPAAWSKHHFFMGIRSSKVIQSPIHPQQSQWFHHVSSIGHSNPPIESSPLGTVQTSNHQSQSSVVSSPTSTVVNRFGVRTHFGWIPKGSRQRTWAETSLKRFLYNSIWARLIFFEWENL